MQYVSAILLARAKQDYVFTSVELRSRSLTHGWAACQDFASTLNRLAHCSQNSLLRAWTF